MITNNKKIIIPKTKNKIIITTNPCNINFINAFNFIN